MNHFPSSVPPDALRADLTAVSFWRDGTGIEMAHEQFKGLPEWLEGAPAIRWAIAELTWTTQTSPAHVMLNRLPAGVAVPWHQDKDDIQYQRWHLPVVTNPLCVFMYVNEEVFMRPGHWWGPIEYWERHSIANKSFEDRVHLVVDVV